MSDLTDATMHSFTHRRNEAKIKEAEQELEAMLGKGEADEEQNDEAEVQQEATEESETEQRVVETKEDDPKEELSAEEKNYKKRYGDLRRHSQEKEKDLQDRLTRLEGQLDKATKNELVLPKSKEDIDAWTQKYPDVAGIVEAIAEKRVAERTTDLDGRLKEIETLRATANREKAEVALMTLHPDFATIRDDDAFHTWAEEQPKMVQDALYENSEDVKSVARVIDLYKADKGIKTKKPSADKGAAAAVKTRTRTVVDSEESTNTLSESKVNKMSLKEYEERQDEIMDAMRSGKFIYDLSQ